MKKYPVFALILALCLACKFGSTENSKTSDLPTKSNNPPISSNKNNQPENRPVNQPPKDGNPLVSLKKDKNKTATEIKLWSNKDVSPRLEKLMGKDYKQMKEVWGVESPMEIEGDILKFTGCEPHNCGPNQYIIYIDTVGDNINVYHIYEDKLKSYTEKDEIKLPKKFAEDFEMNTADLKK